MEGEGSGVLPLSLTSHQEVQGTEAAQCAGLSS